MINVKSSVFNMKNYYSADFLIKDVSSSPANFASKNISFSEDASSSDVFSPLLKKDLSLVKNFSLEKLSSMSKNEILKADLIKSGLHFCSLVKDNMTKATAVNFYINGRIIKNDLRFNSYIKATLIAVLQKRDIKIIDCYEKIKKVLIYDMNYLFNIHIYDIKMVFMKDETGFYDSVIYNIRALEKINMNTLEVIRQHINYFLNLRPILINTGCIQYIDGELIQDCIVKLGGTDGEEQKKI